jgi:hypothetical protein
MKTSAWQAHGWWFVRATLVLAVTGLIDAAAGGLVAKPLPWVVLIPGSLPLSMVFFVALPQLKREKQKSPTDISRPD